MNGEEIEKARMPHEKARRLIEVAGLAIEMNRPSTTIGGAPFEIEGRAIDIARRLIEVADEAIEVAGSSNALTRSAFEVADAFLEKGGISLGMHRRFMEMKGMAIEVAGEHREKGRRNDAIAMVPSGMRGEALQSTDAAARPCARAFRG